MKNYVPINKRTKNSKKSITSNSEPLGTSIRLHGRFQTAKATTETRSNRKIEGTAGCQE